VVFACLSYLYLTLPDVRPLATLDPPTTAFQELRAREARAQGKEPRRIQRWIRYNRVSPSVTRAVLVAEDAAFWRHEGIDFDELRKSVELGWARPQLIRGASTITQQLAKNLYLSPSRNPVRKLRELIIARRLEAELTKVRILELYLNVIEWGDGIYGIEAAARTYFGTSASSLGPRESALLAAAIVNPRLLNPAKPTTRLLRRQRIILGRMGRKAPPAEAPRTPEGISTPPEEPEELDLPADQLSPLPDSDAARPGEPIGAAGDDGSAGMISSQFHPPLSLTDGFRFAYSQPAPDSLSHMDYGGGRRLSFWPIEVRCVRAARDCTAAGADA
jgi:monofunctional biosynthetic peptidoglycan transglycosylase